MKAYQLIQAVGPELQQEIVRWLQTEQRAAYRAAMDNLAVQRKLRPIFLQRKTKEQQAAWLLDQLRLKSGDALAEQVVQIWLLKGQPKMLATFLDAVGIEHDGNGEVKDLPDEIDEKKAKQGIEALLKSYSPAHAALYLHIFQMQKPGGWEGLATAMAGFPELNLQPAAA